MSASRVNQSRKNAAQSSALENPAALRWASDQPSLPDVMCQYAAEIETARGLEKSFALVSGSVESRLLAAAENLLHYYERQDAPAGIVEQATEQICLNALLVRNGEPVPPREPYEVDAEGCIRFFDAETPEWEGYEGQEPPDFDNLPQSYWPKFLLPHVRMRNHCNAIIAEMRQRGCKVGLIDNRFAYKETTEQLTRDERLILLLYQDELTQAIRASIMKCTHCGLSSPKNKWTELCETCNHEEGMRQFARLSKGKNIGKAKTATATRSRSKVIDGVTLTMIEDDELDDDRAEQEEEHERNLAWTTT